MGSQRAPILPLSLAADSVVPFQAVAEEGQPGTRGSLSLSRTGNGSPRAASAGNAKDSGCWSDGSERRWRVRGTNALERRFFGRHTACLGALRLDEARRKCRPFLTGPPCVAASYVKWFEVS